MKLSWNLIDPPVIFRAAFDIIFISIKFVGLYVTPQESLRSANRTREIQKNTIALSFSAPTFPREYGITLFVAVAAFLLGIALGKFAL